MNPILLGYVLLFAGSAVVCLLAIPRARQIQHPGTRHGLVGFLASVALWSGGYTGYLLAHGGQDITIERELSKIREQAANIDDSDREH